MSVSPVAWLALALWSAWAFALQGLCAGSDAFGAWTPEVGVVLMIGLASRMTPERARLGAVVLAGTRAALSAEPLVATLAVYLLLGEAVSGLRRSVDTERLFLRTWLALFGAALVVLWFGWVHAARSDGAAAWSVGPFERVPRAALATALLGLVGGGRLRRLPGIGPLWRKEEPWAIAAPVR